MFAVWNRMETIEDRRYAVLITRLFPMSFTYHCRNSKQAVVGVAKFKESAYEHSGAEVIKGGFPPSRKAKRFVVGMSVLAFLYDGFIADPYLRTWYPLCPRRSAMQFSPAHNLFLKCTSGRYVVNGHLNVKQVEFVLPDVFAFFWTGKRP